MDFSEMDEPVKFLENNPPLKFTKDILNVGVGIMPGIGGSISYDRQVKNLGKHAAFTVGGYVGFSRRDGYALVGGGSGVDFWESKSLVAPRITCQYFFGQKFEVFGALMPGLSIDKYREQHGICINT